MEPGDRTQYRSLTTAAWTQQRYKIALRHVHRQTAYGGTAIVATIDINQGEQFGQRVFLLSKSVLIIINLIFTICRGRANGLQGGGVPKGELQAAVQVMPFANANGSRPHPRRRSEARRLLRPLPHDHDRRADNA